jgi:uncharacterized membrane-anchored protein
MDSTKKYESFMMQARPSKVPEATLAFWVIKILSTGMGETTSDYLVHLVDPVIAVGLVGVVFVASLALQFATRRYIVWVYWLAVVMVSIFGTMVADILHVGFGIPYLISTGFFAVLLGVIFVTWLRSEGTLSIHSITTSRRELFYWATVLTTFALGTAAGDMTATTLNLGYLVSGIIFTVIIAIPALAFRFFGLNAIFAFWFAYVVTRPLGASFADWMGVTPDRGGLALGTGSVSLVVALMIVIATTYLSIKDRQGRALSLQAD